MCAQTQQWAGLLSQLDALSGDRNAGALPVDSGVTDDTAHGVADDGSAVDDDDTAACAAEQSTSPPVTTVFTGYTGPPDDATNGSGGAVRGRQFGHVTRDVLSELDVLLAARGVVGVRRHGAGGGGGHRDGVGSCNSDSDSDSASGDEYVEVAVPYDALSVPRVAVAVVPTGGDVVRELKLVLAAKGDADGVSRDGGE